MTILSCLSAEVTFYEILPGRGYEQAAAILGEDWENHFRTRCEDLIEKVSPAAARFPAQVLEVLHKALALRDRYADTRLVARRE